MTPWNPFPLEIPMTSTRSCGLNRVTRTLSPTAGSSPPGIRRNSFSRRVGGTFALSKWPLSALVTLRALPGSTNPSCTASYPSFALSRRATTTHGPAWTTVQGTVPPSASNTCVIAIFRPISPSTTPASPPFLLERLDLDLHPGGEVELHQRVHRLRGRLEDEARDRKSTRLNSSHGYISYAVFCLKKKKKTTTRRQQTRTSTCPLVPSRR